MNYAQARRRSKERKIQDLARGIRGQAQLDWVLFKVEDHADRAQIFKLIKPYLQFRGATFNFDAQGQPFSPYLDIPEPA